jgi:hypothetical protein
MQLGGCADFCVLLFGIVYLSWCDFTVSNRVNVCEELRQMQLSYPGLSLVTRAGSTVMTLRYSNKLPNVKVQTHRDRERRDKWRTKAKSMLIILLDIKGTFRKEFVLAGQIVSYAYYCDILRWLLENVRRLCPKFWRQKNWLLHHDNARSDIPFCTREFWIKNNMTVVPAHPSFLFPDYK